MMGFFVKRKDYFRGAPELRTSCLLHSCTSRIATSISATIPMSIPTTIQTGVDQTSKPSGLPGRWEIHKKRFLGACKLCDADKVAESIELAKSSLDDASITIDKYLNNCIFLAEASTWEDGHVSYIVPSRLNCKTITNHL